MTDLTPRQLVNMIFAVHDSQQECEQRIRRERASSGKADIKWLERCQAALSRKESYYRDELRQLREATQC